jgi:hypothetical protein
MMGPARRRHCGGYGLDGVGRYSVERNVLREDGLGGRRYAMLTDRPCGSGERRMRHIHGEALVKGDLRNRRETE